MVTLRKEDQEQFEKAKDLMEDGPQGDLGFVRSLFFGRLRLDQVRPYPKPNPEEAARVEELLGKLDVFLKEKVDADKIDAEERVSQDLIDGLGALGVMGMVVPKEYGGGGYSHTSYCRVLERISQTCASTAVLVGAHQSIGLKALVLNGSDEQKSAFLPDLASGKKLAAFCLSEPEVGSDAANIQTQAHLSEDGKHWVLNGHKKFATNAAIAGMLTVMARTPVEIDGQIKEKVTAFIVTPDLPGFEVVSPNRSKCGIRGTWQGTLRFNNMHVPCDRILGELGKGLKVALTVLGFGRCTLSAGCLGSAKVAVDMAVEHARKRKQFGRAIGEFHLVKKKIAHMAEMTFAMDALTYLAAGCVDRKDKDLMIETSMVKLFCSEAGWGVVDDALQIWAGEGYMREHGIERMMRDARINRIVEGTTEVMLSFVALMGMKGVGEEFEEVLRATRHPIKRFSRLTEFAQHEWRDVIVGHTRDHSGNGWHPKLSREGRMLAKLTRALARRVSRALATYRQGILDMQLIQERIAWSATEMYAMAAVMSKLDGMLRDAEKGEGCATLDRDLIVGKAYCLHAAQRTHHRLKNLFNRGDRETLKAADAVLQLGRDN